MNKDDHNLYNSYRRLKHVRIFLLVVPKTHRRDFQNLETQFSLSESLYKHFNISVLFTFLTTNFYVI